MLWTTLNGLIRFYLLVYISIHRTVIIEERKRIRRDKELCETQKILSDPLGDGIVTLHVKLNKENNTQC